MPSDGRLKVDFGWIKVPSISARLQVPIGRNTLTPTPLFDGRPQFIDMAEIGPKENENGKQLWRLVPAHSALKLVLNPIQAQSDALGMVFSAELAVTPIDMDDSPEARERARKAVFDEAEAYAARVADAEAQQPQKDCTLRQGLAFPLWPRPRPRNLHQGLKPNGRDGALDGSGR
jgi:hypothetical protein